MSTKKVIIIGVLVLLLSLIVEILFVHPHAYFWWHEFIAFDAIFGFLGCLLLMGTAKGLGKVFLQQKENFYGGGEDSND